MEGEADCDREVAQIVCSTEDGDHNNGDSLQSHRSQEHEVQHAAQLSEDELAKQLPNLISKLNNGNNQDNNAKGSGSSSSGDSSQKSGQGSPKASGEPSNSQAEKDKKIHNFRGS